MLSQLDYTDNNVTQRRGPKKHSKMELAHNVTRDHCSVSGDTKYDSLLIDSILSRTEEEEVLKMLTIEGEMQDRFSGFTSTQMNRGRSAKLALSMSLIMSDSYQNPSCGGNDGDWDTKFTHNRFSPSWRVYSTKGIAQ